MASHMSMKLTDADLKLIERGLSPERLSSYASLNLNLSDTIALHQQILTVGARLALIIAVIEISLRNEVSYHLQRQMGLDDWLFNNPTGFIWGKTEKNSIEKAKNNAQRSAYAKLSNIDKKKLDLLAFPNGIAAGATHDSIARKRQKAISVSQGQVVTQLTLFFWKRLFSSDYEIHLWKRSLRRTFPNKLIKRTQVADVLEVLYVTRNRLAHHEPVYSGRLISALHAIDFFIRNFQTTEPVNDTPIATLLAKQLRDLENEIETLNTMLPLSYRTKSTGNTP